MFELFKWKNSGKLEPKRICLVLISPLDIVWQLPNLPNNQPQNTAFLPLKYRIHLIYFQE